MNEDIRNINNQFRNTIRRKNIDQLFSKRRKQLSTQLPPSLQLPSLSSHHQLYLQVERDILENSSRLNPAILKSLSKLSMNEESVKLLSPQQFIFPLCEYVGEEHVGSQSQYYATFTLLNILYQNDAGVVAHESFLQNLYPTALNASHKTRENCMSILFQIIHDASLTFLENLLVQEHLNVIRLMSHQINSEPSYENVQETLRCFYLLLKRLKFPNHHVLIKMRKPLLMIIKNSNTFQQVYMATMCLNAVVICLPDESDLSKTGVLKTITTKALKESNENFTLLVIKILSNCLPKSPHDQLKSTIIPFTLSCLTKFANHSIKIQCYKLFYQICMIDKDNFRLILQVHPNYYENLVSELHESGDRAIITEICFCICISLWSKGAVSEEMVVMGRNKIGRILDVCKLDPKAVEFIQQTLLCTKY